MIYKVIRNIKHPVHGWLIVGRFVECRPEYAKNHVIRRELVRVSAEKQDSIRDRLIWIDSQPEPEEVAEPESIIPKKKKGRKSNAKISN